MAVPRDWKLELEENGFAIVPQVIASSVVDSLLEQTAAHPRYAIRHLAQSIPAFRAIANSSAIQALVKPVLGANAFLARSLLFDKTPQANWKVAWHQDLTIAVERKIDVGGFTAWSMKKGIAHVQPPSAVLERMLTVRLHLDDCDVSNGALQVIPGSHNAGKLDAEAIGQWRTAKPPAICAVPRCGVLLMRPLLLHASSSADRPSHRRVAHLEFAAESLPGGLQWHSVCREV
ncbi:MAG TPA: phytanoyl-CoA dioxygenase family protein [Candidatus Saccharimonadales bacterium]|nr:phytanoyl-CoA dioxygenase family protein [Candidatus Saccharimonadales bacterium]